MLLSNSTGATQTDKRDPDPVVELKLRDFSLTIVVHWGHDFGHSCKGTCVHQKERHDLSSHEMYVCYLTCDLEYGGNMPADKLMPCRGHYLSSEEGQTVAQSKINEFVRINLCLPQILHSNFVRPDPSQQ